MKSSRDPGVPSNHGRALQLIGLRMHISPVMAGLLIVGRSRGTMRFMAPVIVLPCYDGMMRQRGEFAIPLVLGSEPFVIATTTYFLYTDTATQETNPSDGLHQYSRPMCIKTPQLWPEIISSEAYQHSKALILSKHVCSRRHYLYLLVPYPPSPRCGDCCPSRRAYPSQSMQHGKPPVL